MAERKVLNKYYPPDFDPSKLPRTQQPKNLQTIVRNSLPFTIRCYTCSNYMYQGTKCNMRKEDVQGEAYLGEIQVFRFYFKCSSCSAELAMKTDPQNHDYVMENGASCAYTATNVITNEVAKFKKGIEEHRDPLKTLENWALDFKEEANIRETIEELESMQYRRTTVNADVVRSILQRMEKEKEITEDEFVVKSTVFRNSKKYVQRIDDNDDEPSKSANNEILAKRRKVGVEDKGCNSSMMLGPSFRIRIKPKVSYGPTLATISTGARINDEDAGILSEATIEQSPELSSVESNPFGLAYDSE